MKITPERSSMTYALIFYARLGGAAGCDTPFDVYKRIEGAAPTKSLALDTWAVYECLRMLDMNGCCEEIRALREIYFLPFSRDLDMRINRRMITELVCRFAADNYLDERTVYRRLHKARRLWLRIRESAERREL